MSYIVAAAARWTKSLKLTLSIAVHTGGHAKNNFWLVAKQKKRIGEQLNYFWNMCPKPFSWAKNKRKLFSDGKSRGPLLAGAALNTLRERFYAKIKNKHGWTSQTTIHFHRKWFGQRLNNSLNCLAGLWTFLRPKMWKYHCILLFWSYAVVLIERTVWKISWFLQLMRAFCFCIITMSYLVFLHVYYLYLIPWFFSCNLE